MTAGPSLGAVSSVVLAGLLTVACVSDLRSRRIPNLLVLVVAAAGFALAAVTKPWLSGLTEASLGMLTGLAIWFPFYLLRMLGAGDVKLFAAASKFLGPRLAIEGALYTALYGGAIALIWMIVSSGWVSTVVRVSHSIQAPAEAPRLLHNQPTARRRMPYAFAIAAGILTAIFWPGHLFS